MELVPGVISVVTISLAHREPERRQPVQIAGEPVL
jgi:hypothetical protein